MLERQENAAASPDLLARAERLTEALRQAGGVASVARRIGMPVPTLNNYVAGRDMKASALVALADACGVSLEWLGAGRGAASSASQSPSPGFAPDDLSAPVNFLALVMLLASCQEFHQRMHKAPSLAEALRWVGVLYRDARPLKDGPIKLTVPEDWTP